MDKAVQYVTDTATSWFNAMPTFLRVLVIVLGSGIAGIIYIARSVKKISQGNVAMRLRWGRVILRYDKSLPKDERDRLKAIDRSFTDIGQCAIYGRPRYYSAGRHLGIPFIDTWDITNMLGQPIKLAEQNVLDKLKKFEGCRFAEPMINIRVTDPYLARYVNENPQELIAAIANTELSKTLYDYTPENVVASIGDITKKTIDAIAPELATMGMEATSLQLGAKRPMTEGWTAQAIASLKMADIESVVERFTETDELDSSLADQL